jgi:hypothetical protein
LFFALLNHCLINITPAPTLAWLEGLHDGVMGGVEMRGGVLVLRGVTAAYVPTDEAFAQMHPAIACLQTLFAPLRARRDLSDLVKVHTLFCHSRFSAFLSLIPMIATICCFYQWVVAYSIETIAQNLFELF